MKVHYIKADDKLMIFAIVDKKRKDFQGDNIACVRVYDLKKYTQIPKESIGISYVENDVNDIINIETARRGWDEFVRRAEENNYGIRTAEAIYKTMNGSPILTDSEITEAMDDICRKQIWRMKNPYSKEEEPTTGKGELQNTPKGTKYVTMEDVAPHLMGNSATVVSEDELTNNEKISETIHDTLGIITSDYKDRHINE